MATVWDFFLHLYGMLKVAKEEWENIPLEMFQDSLSSWSDRVLAIHKAHGHDVPQWKKILCCKFDFWQTFKVWSSAENQPVVLSLQVPSCASILEPPSLNRGNNKRPDGLTIYPCKFGKPLVWDVTVVNTFVYRDYISQGGRSSRVQKAA